MELWCTELWCRLWCKVVVQVVVRKVVVQGCSTLIPGLAEITFGWKDKPRTDIQIHVSGYVNRYQRHLMQPVPGVIHEI